MQERIKGKVRVSPVAVAFASGGNRGATLNCKYKLLGELKDMRKTRRARTTHPVPSNDGPERCWSFGTGGRSYERNARRGYCEMQLGLENKQNKQQLLNMFLQSTVKRKRARAVSKRHGIRRDSEAALKTESPMACEIINAA
ncbi:hypothetical protein MRX96_025834 [Rhipicephalus microplus]